MFIKENGKENGMKSVDYFVSSQEKFVPVFNKIVTSYLEMRKNGYEKSFDDLTYSDRFWPYLMGVVKEGKKLRPMSHFESYKLVGGHELPKIAYTAMSPELLHIGSLIQDDVLDRSVLRHGTDTVYTMYAKIYFKDKTGMDYNDKLLEIMKVGDKPELIAVNKNSELVTGIQNLQKMEELEKTWAEAEEWGKGKASLLSHTFVSLSEDVLDQASLSNANIEKIKKMRKESYDMLSAAVGSELDIERTGLEDVTDKAYTKIIGGKTNIYNYAMVSGAILGGAGDEQLKLIHKLGTYFIRAFQMSDDKLILYKDEKTKKDTWTDIRGGRPNILLIDLHRLLEERKDDNLKKFHSVVSSQNATREDCEEIRRMMYEFKVDQKVQDRIERSLNIAGDALSKIKVKDDKSYKFFEGALEYLLFRTV